MRPFAIYNPSEANTLMVHPISQARLALGSYSWTGWKGVTQRRIAYDVASKIGSVWAHLRTST